ncbi:MAG: PQQ-binding-like beta-propeller repeat protein [Verrucomicrobia bacterium]|nr:PQQ-binding-like beta-propeller repeat protein [Verrucomicrobiota bacterium]
MRRTANGYSSLALALCLGAPLLVEAEQGWPRWRGPLATGAAPAASPPLRWSETENLKWKVAVPGFGTSTPVIWGDRVFLLTAKASGKQAEATPAAGNPFGTFKPEDTYQFIVLCYRRADGSLLWQRIVREEVPHEGHHRDHGFASGSPVTDGERLYAHFGSRGVYCLDLDGNLIWERDFGDMETRNAFGEGSSPALHGDTLVINWDHEGEDFIVALDKRTGETRWRRERDEPTGWATPLVVEHENRAQVIVNATGKVRSYDLASGEVIWECGGQTVNVIPSPVARNGVVYVTSGFRGSALFAIGLGATGDLAGTRSILWSHHKSTPYVPSPLIYEDLLYFVSGNTGMLSCFDAGSGLAHYEAERLPGLFGIYASPVAAAGRVYVMGRDGTAMVLKAGPTLEVLATNKLDDKVDASLALVDGEVFVRGHQHLYCLAE